MVVDLKTIEVALWMPELASDVSVVYVPSPPDTGVEEPCLYVTYAYGHEIIEQEPQAMAHQLADDLREVLVGLLGIEGIDSLPMVSVTFSCTLPNGENCRLARYQIMEELYRKVRDCPAQALPLRESYSSFNSQLPEVDAALNAMGRVVG
jgi:hypothetical protein